MSANPQFTGPRAQSYLANSPQLRLPLPGAVPKVNPTAVVVGYLPLLGCADGLISTDVQPSDHPTPTDSSTTRQSDLSTVRLSRRWTARLFSSSYMPLPLRGITPLTPPARTTCCLLNSAHAYYYETALFTMPIISFCFSCRSIRDGRSDRIVLLDHLSQLLALRYAERPPSMMARDHQSSTSHADSMFASIGWFALQVVCTANREST